jgi:hypothetical protein
MEQFDQPDAHVAGAIGPNWATESDAVHDELAEMFIGPADAAQGDDVAEFGPTRACRVEALALGNLPVRASLWVRAYASLVAEREREPVGLVRVGRSAVDAERHTPPGEAEASGLPRRWIVRVEDMDQPTLLRASAPDRVTVLTGADDASVVACYGLLKSLAGEHTARFGVGGGPELCVAIAGASANDAFTAGRRLRAVVQKFLDRTLALCPTVERVGVTRVRRIASFEGAEGIDELIRTIRATHSIAASAQGHPAASEDLVRSAKTGTSTDMGRVGHRPTRAKDEDMDAFGDGYGAPHGPDAHGTSESDVVARVGPEPARARRRSRRGPVERPDRPVRVDAGVGPSEAKSPPRLAELVSGLTALPFTCPTAPEIELARDAQGRLHVLTRFGREGLDAAMTAAAWARLNAELIARCGCGVIESSARSGATVHVTGPDARDLRALGDADVRLHLVREVQTPGGSAWVCDPLN